MLRTFSSVAWESFAAVSQNSRRIAIYLQRARNSRQCSPCMQKLSWTYMSLIRTRYMGVWSPRCC